MRALPTTGPPASIEKMTTPILDADFQLLARGASDPGRLRWRPRCANATTDSNAFEAPAPRPRQADTDLRPRQRRRTGRGPADPAGLRACLQRGRIRCAGA